MMWKTKQRLSLFTLGLALLLSGCSGTSIYTDYHEVEDLELIRTIGVDEKEG